MVQPTVGEWLDRFFAAYYARRPVNATFIGIHQFDHLLPDYSESGIGDTTAEMERLLAESTRLAPAQTPAEAIDLRLAAGFLETQLWEFRSQHFQAGNPSLYTGEAIFGAMSLFLSSEPPSVEAIDAAAARLSATPRFLASARDNLRSAHPGWVERARRECTGAAAFLTDGIKALAADRIRVSPAFEKAAASALSAFQAFDHFLERDLSRQPREIVSAGPDALRLYLTKGHFIPTDPDEVARCAEDQLAAAKATLATLPTEVGVDPAGADYSYIWNEVKDLAERHQLLTWPDFPIQYRSRPRWAERAAPDLYFLFYRSPPAIHRPAVHHYLVPPSDPGQSAVKLNHVIHHGAIGHHVQNWHAFRAESRIGRIAAVDCASRIALFSGGTMAEGWACYATDLMNEIGYLTPFEQRDEVKTRCRMCARAVVDVRLHQGEWSLDDAAAFYGREAGMEPAPARNEAIKNSMFPGAALMYLEGTDRIHRLRKEMARHWGNQFTLRRFHDRFLAHGSIPVALIAESMTAIPSDEATSVQ